ncbi:uncharacterized protein RCC_10687 [Ramularia collo-cygni]|uniref:Protein kinase domain-containing protein n=1 Tax=Ramularia collo-cygni TaxID=112498 RepID=A0A2D3VRG6_9PEZI|nr:uncharacterized protein RCC_10687 [Ramularia collo-cygni]CZT24958.1 uncharacterized protein RCC_10687 [Ramularia collo-cygni]
MWVRVDEDENIAERRVVKTVQVLRDVWLDATKWTGDVKDYQQRLPMDYHLQRKLCTAADGGEFFNRVRACVIDNEAWTYKLVLDYCDQGHVGSILRRYRDEDGDGNVPEPLAWSILEGLIKAVLVMQQGAIQSQEEDWKEVVHRDFKPDNVFLTRVPNSEYPRIQLSDFEHSIETTRDDPFNPKVWREDAAGHDAYWAPELRTPRHRAAIIRGYPEKGLSLPTIPRQDLTADKVCSTVNVWNIGTTMFTLMCGAEIRPVKFEGVDYPGMLWNREDMWWENWDRGALEYYSEELVQLVRNCLEDDPTMRPTPGELLLSVQAVSEDALCERRKGARGATADDVNNWDDDDGPMDYIRAADRYKIGLSFDTLATGEDLSSDWSVNASDEGS